MVPDPEAPALAWIEKRVERRPALRTKVEETIFGYVLGEIQSMNSECSKECVERKRAWIESQ